MANLPSPYFAFLRRIITRDCTAAYDKGTILFIQHLSARSNATYICEMLRIGLAECFQSLLAWARCIGRIFSVQMDVNCGNEKAFLRESTTASKGLFLLAERELHPVSLRSCNSRRIQNAHHPSRVEDRRMMERDFIINSLTQFAKLDASYLQSVANRHPIRIISIFFNQVH